MNNRKGAMMDDVKQIILIRKDLKMRRGKEIAQGAHAATACLVAALRTGRGVSDTMAIWLAGGHKKVCLQVASEEELVAAHERALRAGVTSHLVVDQGRTEFAGVPTVTACAIGPDRASAIDMLTANLKLY